MKREVQGRKEDRDVEGRKEERKEWEDKVQGRIGKRRDVEGEKREIMYKGGRTEKEKKHDILYHAQERGKD